MILDCDAKAVLWGLGVFLGLYVLHLLLLPWLVGAGAGGKEGDAALYGLHQFLGLATCLVSGFVAARIAGNRGFLHGGLVGLLGTLVTALLAMLWAGVTGAKFLGLTTLPFWLMVNGFLGAFAGIVATNLQEDPEDAA